MRDGRMEVEFLAPGLDVTGKWQRRPDPIRRWRVEKTRTDRNFFLL